MSDWAFRERNGMEIVEPPPRDPEEPVRPFVNIIDPALVAMMKDEVGMLGGREGGKEGRCVCVSCKLISKEQLSSLLRACIIRPEL